MTAARSARYLIINADDFGLSSGVCAGIIQAWRAGTVTSTSVLINIPGALSRVAAAHARYPDLPMGLHLNITTGPPVLPAERVPTLVDATGHFRPLPDLIPRLPFVELADIRAEVWAQAALLVRSGVRFDHIDYHDHALVVYPVPARIL